MRWIRMALVLVCGCALTACTTGEKAVGSSNASTTGVWVAQGNEELPGPHYLKILEDGRGAITSEPHLIGAPFRTEPDGERRWNAVYPKTEQTLAAIEMRGNELIWHTDDEGDFVFRPTDDPWIDAIFDIEEWNGWE